MQDIFGGPLNFLSTRVHFELLGQVHCEADSKMELAIQDIY